MQNIMVINPQYIQRVFDLKGSMVDRKTKNLEKTPNTTALKDQDLFMAKKIYPGVIL